MECPKCRAGLEASSVDTGHLHRCLSCDGFWLERRTLSDLIRRATAAAGIAKKAIGLIETMPVKTRHRCPECTTIYLDAVRFRAVEVERCATCAGVFLDSGELQIIAERVIDAQRQWCDEEAEWAQLAMELKLKRAQATADQSASTANLAMLVGAAAFLSH